MSKKRGPKSKATKLEELKEVIKERDEYRSQIHRRETNYEQRQRSEHDEEIRKLKSALETAADSAQTARAKASALEIAADKALATLTAERIANEGARLEAERIAQKHFNTAIALKERMITTRDGKLDLLKEEILALSKQKVEAERVSDERIEALDAVCAERLVTIRKISGKLGGRPCNSRTEDELDELQCATASASRISMMDRVADVIGEHGTDTEISLPVLIQVLVRNGYMQGVWESEEMWELRMDWLQESSNDLSLSWDAEHSRRVRDKLVISYDKMDELRHMFSHHRVGKQLVPRPWVINPWTGRRVNYPQPIRPRCGALGWARLVKAAQTRFGLTMDACGRIAQRSYAATVGLQFERDLARGILKDVSEDAPLIAVLGADGTGVGKRSMMHVASSIAPSYRDGISVENEKNINTVATSITDDHWGGVN